MRTHSNARYSTNILETLNDGLISEAWSATSVLQFDTDEARAILRDGFIRSPHLMIPRAFSPRWPC
jgi:hypothetical protein